MLEACLSSSISSRVFTTRAAETAGQPFTILRPVFVKGFERGHVQVVDADLFLGHAVFFQHFHHAFGHASGHVGHRALRPLPGDRRTNAPFHPRQVDLGALQVRAGGLKQNRFAAVRHHGIANIDVVFPVALIGSRGVADVRPSEEHQRAEVVLRHLRAQLLQTLLAQAVEIHAVLPIRAGLAVQAARVPFVRFAKKTDIH